MKISNGINITSSLIAQEDTKAQKEKVQADAKRMTEPPVKISISDEGQENYRKSVGQKGQESYDAVIQRRELLKDQKLGNDINYGYKIAKEAEQLSAEAAHVADTQKSKVLNTNDMASNYAKAYAKLYDEIVQGYENGTRERYVTGENGTRKLTKEEELSALDKAYQKTVDDFVTLAKTNEHARGILKEYGEQVLKIGSVTAETKTFLDNQKTRENDTISENLSEKMLKAVASFKEQYAMLDPSTDKLSQLLLNIKISQ